MDEPAAESEHLSGTSIFKALTGGDFGLEGEHKFRDGFSFDPFCRLVFSANSPPRSSDASEAFFDRWLVVPFDARFRGTAREMTRKELDARLSAPNELSGLLNKAVDAWRAIQARGGKFSEPESVRAAWAEFHAMTDPLSVWLDQFTVDDPQAAVPKQVLRAAYGAACKRAGRPALTETGFGLAFNKARPAVNEAQRTLNGRRQRCYIGIGLRVDDSATAHPAQGAQGYPPLFLTQAREENDEGSGSKRDGEKVIQGRENPVHPVQAVHKANGHGCPSCGHPEFVDVPIHGGQSARRDCANCGRFVDFVNWQMAADDGEAPPSTPAP